VTLFQPLNKSYFISNLIAFAKEDCGNPISQSQLDQVAQALESIHAKGVVHGDIAL
jgi:serine/threonine protein kinase